MHWAAKGNLHSVTRAMTDKGGQVNVKDRVSMADVVLC